MKHFTLELTNSGVTLTAYLLDASGEMSNANVRPAIMICPGGAYRVCSDREAEPIAMAFLAEGYHVFVLRYSLNEHAAFPRPLNDAEEALEIIRQRGDEWGVDTDRVVACGFSAGGHLAAALGTMGRVRPNALLLGYPCILESMGGILPAPIPDVSQTVDGSTPPTFLFHTYSDTLVPVGNSLAFASALEREKVPFEMHIFQNGAHGLSLAKPSTSGGSRSMVDNNAAKWFDLSTAWLKQVIGDFPADRDGSWDVEVEQYGVDIPLGVLWKNTRCKKLVLEYLPILADSTQLDDAMGVPLRMVVEFGGGLLTNEQVDELDEALRAVPAARSA